MDPNRTIAILNRLIRIHESVPDLAMMDISNEEIIEALIVGRNSVELLVELTREATKKK